MLFRRYILTVLLLLFTSSAFSQLWKISRLEATAAVGTSHFFGDIGGYTSDENYLGFRDISFHNTGFVAAGVARYRLTNNLAVRLNLAGGVFRSSDSWGSNMGRGYESNTVYFEPSLIAEFYIFRNKMENSYLFIKGYRTPQYRAAEYFDYYLFAGLGGLAWDVTPNPELALRLQKANGFNNVIPAGIGVNRIFPGNIKAGLELGGRYVLSDLSDGYAGLGSERDIYYFLTFNMTWRIKTHNTWLKL